IQHRLATAGLSTASPFQPVHMKQIYRLTVGVPRRINLLCDRALLGAYAKGTHDIDRDIIEQAAGELFINQGTTRPVARTRARYAVAGLFAIAMAAGAAAWTMHDATLLDALNRQWLAATTATSAEDNREALHIVVTDAPPEPDKPVTTAPASDPQPETPSAILSEQDGTFRAGLRNDKTLLRQLARIWGTSLDEGEPCEAVKQAGLRCYRSSSGFAELRQLDRPAVIKLYDQANRTHYALLTALNDDSATLRADDAVQTLGRAALTPYFRGEFVTLWRAPPGFDATVKAGDQGPDVDRIGAQLAKLYNDTAPGAGEPFNPRTMKQVRHFQQAQGLFVDGSVGPVTLMHLNRAVGLDEPRLIKDPKGPATMRENAASGE
ncbi:MAG: peptidoglycan-binding protein, partial [Noviherbaspirillum sp.]